MVDKLNFTLFTSLQIKTWNSKISAKFSTPCRRCTKQELHFLFALCLINNIIIGFSFISLKKSTLFRAVWNYFFKKLLQQISSCVVHIFVKHISMLQSRLKKRYIIRFDVFFKLNDQNFTKLWQNWSLSFIFLFEIWFKNILF